MGLTTQSMGRGLRDSRQSGPQDSRRIVALAGNPNVGKSTVFNALTGRKQHTGNWPGKTVELARGSYTYKAEEYALVDLPGTYSLLGKSEEELVAARFIRSGGADCVAAVCDATCLERNLILVLQLMELTDRLVVCVNLMDEAGRQELTIDLRALERELGVPVVGTAAGPGQGLDGLQERIRNVVEGFERPHPHRVGLSGEKTGDLDALVRRAEEIGARVVTRGSDQAQRRQRKADRLLMGPVSGYALALLLLLAVFWLTIKGANVPSALLDRGFGLLHARLWSLAEGLAVPWWLASPLLDGVLGTTGKVISVMLPPVCIFFPLFTLLEDVGYLPRLACLLDSGFARCGACGKQALTTCMGFGCNAAGVIGCRIIDSPRERLIGILTNSFVPCNGRFPALIALCAVLLGGNSSALGGALLLCGWVLLGVLGSMGASALLSRTLLKGLPSSFALELPPYRKPRLGRVLLGSVRDRVLGVLGRAAAVAAPAGLVLWCLANIPLAEGSVLSAAAAFLEPLGGALGMNGMILLAFVLALPANELVLPIALMGAGGLENLMAMEEGSLTASLLAAGWDGRTALCALVFFLFHWPCSTTLLTIKRETGSWRWTLLAAALPTALGLGLCLLLNALLPR